MGNWQWLHLEKTGKKVNKKRRQLTLGTLSNFKILSVFAHYEDHILFGWPLLQYRKLNNYLFNCTSECQERVLTTCEDYNIKHVGFVDCLENGFGDPKRNIKNKKLVDSNYTTLKYCIKIAIADIQPDVIFTHNPWGEYGHLDHRMVFEVLFNEFNIPIFTTDIRAKSSYYHYYENGIPKLFKPLYNKNIITVSPDYAFFQKNANTFGASWTKNKNLNIPNFPKQTGVYCVK